MAKFAVMGLKTTLQLIFSDANGASFVRVVPYVDEERVTAANVNALATAVIAAKDPAGNSIFLGAPARLDAARLVKVVTEQAHIALDDDA